ncbi:MAG: class I SAM-dependent methyltransferase [Thermostichales cyanobacterium SZTDM-1c_bins_54]
MDPITAAVQAQYEAFPYPPVPIEQPVQGKAPYCSYRLGQYARTGLLQDPGGKRALVAGCGSGHEIHLVAVTNPGLAEVVGVDLSQRSIELARERLAYHGLHHCSAQVGNLLDADSLPQGPFDWIVSFGVIHHTRDPVLALSHLQQRLTPGGMLALMLYNQDGRYPVYQIRRALELLGAFGIPAAEQVALARAILAAAQPQTITAAHYRGNGAYYRHDENVIDNFFHPQDRPLTMVGIGELLTQAGLAFVDVVPDPHSWRIEQIISPTCGPFYERYRQLSRLEQLRIMECLHPSGRTCSVFWACRPQDLIRSPKDPRASSWQLNPDFADWGSLSWGGQVLGLQDPLPFSGAGYVDLRWALGQSWRLSGEEWALLTSIADHPRKGSRLFAHASPAVLQKWQRWEQDYLVMRVGEG